jgi:excisionase family DNA binding protein
MEGRMLEFRVVHLARELGVHRNTVTNWIKNGRLKASPAVGKKYTIRKEDFDRFCRERGIPDVIHQRLASAQTGAHIEARPRDNHSHQPMPTKEDPMPDKPIGSVMVVGGGIAGIQATLDLADSGYFVYLVEKTAGIGGVMAQLDKTYPTNDCAM